MTKLVKIHCKNCNKIFLKDRGHYKENLKFGHNFYCSRKCEYKYKTKRETLKCENCGKPFRRTPHEISPHNYCSQSCAAIVNNKKCLKGHAKIKPKLKTCVKCGKQFRKSTGNKKYCSIKCRREAGGHTPKEILGIIRDTAQKLGRIPARRELREIDGACRRFFGSWNNAVITAGFQPNRSHNQRMYKQSKTYALDGHLCDSVSEALVDNWLAENNIPHKRNLPYPRTNHKADWGININGQNVLVEYFGLANDSPRYDRAVRKKKGLCRRYKIRLIEVYPQDIYPKKSRDSRLREKIRSLMNS